MTTAAKVAFVTGSRIVGKWNKQEYCVKRLLGEGANGKVYLVQKGHTQYALKIGFDSIDLQSEANVLKTLDSRIRRHDPYLLEVDDLSFGGRQYPFYVMKYVQGRQIHEFVRNKGPDWFYVVGKNLLTRLAELHHAGWQFCDLKMENVIVGEYGQTELVDYGGVTPHGSSVKQFTEMYDRGYWRCGSRIADETYDLFSFAVMCIHLIVPAKKSQAAFAVLPQNRSAAYLQELLAEDQTLVPFHSFIAHALEGRFKNVTEALSAWKQIRWRGQGQEIAPRNATARLRRVLFVSITFFLLTVMFVFQFQ